MLAHQETKRRLSGELSRVVDMPRQCYAENPPDTIRRVRYSMRSGTVPCIVASVDALLRMTNGIVTTWLES